MYESERQIRADERKQIKVAAERNRAERDRIYNEYMRYIKEGMTDEDAREHICERFECTDRKITNILNQRAGTLSPQAKSMSEANLLVLLSRINDISSVAANQFVSQLKQLDLSDDDWVDVAQSNTVGGKGGDSTTTQRVSRNEYKAKLYDRLLDTVERPVKAVERLLPKNVINFNDNRTKLQSMSIDELNEQLAETEKELRGKSER